MTRANRLKRFNQALPDALDLITRALRAGHSISAAIEIVGQEAVEPVRAEFREVSRRQNFGLPHREALLELASRVPSQDLQFVITAMLVQKETGGNLVDTLERTAAVVRDRMRIQGEVRTYTAQGRMTGYILGALPIIMFFLSTWRTMVCARAHRGPDRQKANLRGSYRNGARRFTNSQDCQYQGVMAMNPVLLRQHPDHRVVRRRPAGCVVHDDAFAACQADHGSDSHPCRLRSCG